ncbi:MAG: 3TM-type holin [Gammaproteobacteria bacterium]
MVDIWSDVKKILTPAAPLLSAALSMTGPAGMVAGGILSAVTGKSDPQSIALALQDPQTLAQIKLAEIRSADQLNQAIAANATAQANTNTAMAYSPFLIGWRAWVGYDCALALTWQWVILPIIQFVCGLFHVNAPVVEFDTAAMITLLSAMLGVATWHVADKAIGVPQ